jgi:LEA14-like dessication related protein
MSWKTLAGAAAIALVACSKPVPPKLTPRSATVTRVGIDGADLDVNVDADNSNDFEIDAKSIDVKILFNGVEAGTASVPQTLRLPAHAVTPVKARVAVKWVSLIALAPVLQSGKAVPFTVEGSLVTEGRLAIRIPFTVNGELTHEQVVQLGLSAIPKIPGLPGLGR